MQAAFLYLMTTLIHETSMQKAHFLFFAILCLQYTHISELKDNVICFCFSFLYSMPLYDKQSKTIIKFSQLKCCLFYAKILIIYTAPKCEKTWVMDLRVTFTVLFFFWGLGGLIALKAFVYKHMYRPVKFAVKSSKWYNIHMCTQANEIF